MIKLQFECIKTPHLFTFQSDGVYNQQHSEIGLDHALVPQVGQANHHSGHSIKRCNDRDLVADAIQDTFVAVWQRPQGFRGDGDIAAWLWGIAIRRLVSRLRTGSSVAAVFENPGAAPAAEDQVLLSVEYGDIGQALARLSPEMRAVIQAVVLDGLSAREAAQLLHVPVSSVKTRLYRAKAHLRAALAEGPS